MFTIWIIGVVVFIFYRAFNAGMNSKSLFYRDPRYSEGPARVFDSDKAFGYCLVTLFMSLTWIISLPLLIVYKLGQRFNKEK
jgi:hypothetical protein